MRTPLSYTAGLLVASLVAAVVFVIGPVYGYAPFHAAVFVWAFVAPAVTTGLAFSRCFRWRGLTDAVLRALVCSFAAVVGTTMALGSVGMITAPAVLGVLVVACGIAVWLARHHGATPGRVAMNLPLLLVGVSAALFVVVAADGITHSPLTAYDSLSYHLFFPARWLQEHGVSIVATPFSDEAQAYAPANGELYFLWLMLPLHGDLLARVGQLPFYVAAALALYALARRAGATPSRAMYPALFCLLSRPMLEQALGADVDLICWVLFLCAIHVGWTAAQEDRRSDWLLFGAIVGLYAGTKYVALVYAPVLVVLLLWPSGEPRRLVAWPPRQLARRMLWTLPGVLAFGAPWYVRNWIAAGSPLYPASLTVAGVTIAAGAYSRTAMLHSVFHTTDIRLLPVMVAHAMGVTLAVAWLPFALPGAWRLARASRVGALLAVLPLLMGLLYWVGVPDNVDSRFMLPIAMLLLLPLAFVFGSSRPANSVIHAIYGLAIAWIVIGVDAEIPARLPWFMGGWLSLRGVAAPPAWIILCAAAALAVVAWRVAGARARAATLLLLVAGGSATLTVAARRTCGDAPCEYLQPTSIFLRQSFVDAWRWTDAHLAQAVVAYTGNNVPYPLAGTHLTNRVVYVNIDRHARWRFHDYDRAARARPALATGDLATSSGVLLPLPASAGRPDAVRPRYERMHGDREAWVQNLETAGVTHLFISALSAYEIDYVWHNADGFPIEDEWARADADAFELAYANPQVRIYVVHLRRRAS